MNDVESPHDDGEGKDEVHFREDDPQPETTPRAIIEMSEGGAVGFRKGQLRHVRDKQRRPRARTSRNGV